MNIKIYFNILRTLLQLLYKRKGSNRLKRPLPIFFSFLFLFARLYKDIRARPNNHSYIEEEQHKPAGAYLNHGEFGYVRNYLRYYGRAEKTRYAGEKIRYCNCAVNDSGGNRFKANQHADYGYKPDTRNYELRDFLFAYKRKEEYDNSQKKSYRKEYQCAEQRAVYG